jgi:hypothetical protein
MIFKGNPKNYLTEIQLATGWGEYPIAPARFPGLFYGA